MAELEALVEEKLPRAISGLKRESMVLRLLLLEGPNPRDPTIEGLRSATVSRQRKADKAVGKQMARLLVLESRVKRIHKHSPYWGRLFMSYVRLRLEQHAVDLVTMDLVDLTRISDEDWADRWQKIEQRRADLAKIIRSVTETMKPPPRQFVYRVRQRLRDRKRRSLQNASAPPA